MYHEGLVLVRARPVALCYTSSSLSLSDFPVAIGINNLKESRTHSQRTATVSQPGSSLFSVPWKHLHGVVSICSAVLVVLWIFAAFVKLMKMFSEFACVSSIWMCFPRLQFVELSGPPYRRALSHFYPTKMLLHGTFAYFYLQIWCFDIWYSPRFLRTPPAVQLCDGRSDSNNSVVITKFSKQLFSEPLPWILNSDLYLWWVCACSRWFVGNNGNAEPLAHS